MEIYKIKNLSFSYPQSSKKILDDINLTINDGEFVVVCGKSGSGKSTLLKHLKPILTPHGEKNGDILFENTNINEVDFKSQSQKIGYVFQSPDNQIVTDKVWHELAFGLESLGIEKNSIRLKVAEMASFFGITDWFMKKTLELSGGQKQILNLASIMAMQPKVLILDEPTSQLDPIAATEFIRTLEKINKELGTTIILSEHRLEEVLPVADKVVVLEEGKIIANTKANLLAKILKNQSSQMFKSLPCAMKISLSFNNCDETAITVKDAKMFLHELLSGKNIENIDYKQENFNNENIISIKNVWFKYEKNEKDVLQDFSLDVKKGTIHALLGGNGVGKSTALSVLTRVNKPYKGSVYINGKNIKKYKSNELFINNLGVLPQNPQALFVQKTVELDLLDAFEFEKNEEKKQQEIHQICELLDIESLLNSHPYDLSGGEQQRVAIAKVMLLKPKILIFDEPTKGLDSFLKEKLAEIFEKIKKQGGTILIVSHDIEFCGKYADICSLFFNGNIVTTQPTRSFFSGNNFYTTAANRIARDIFPCAITTQEVIHSCQKTLKK